MAVGTCDSVYWRLGESRFASEPALSGKQMRLGVSAGAQEATDYYIGDLTNQPFASVPVSFDIERSLNDPKQYCLRYTEAPVFSAVEQIPSSLYLYDATNSDKIWASWDINETGIVVGEDLEVQHQNDELTLCGHCYGYDAYVFAFFADKILSQGNPVINQTWFTGNDIKLALLIGTPDHNPDATLSAMLDYEISGTGYPAGGMSLANKGLHPEVTFTEYLYADAVEFDGVSIVFDTVLLYDATAGVPLAAHYDSDQTVSGDLTIKILDDINPEFRVYWKR
ncbi:MAG: hypothetical protein KAT62_00785 [Desulfuromonadales bacterium]|nr:hypothetical protein [Desulfuromonadales bacterium]